MTPIIPDVTRRAADLATEWVGTAYGASAAAVRGTLALGRSRQVQIDGHEGRQAVLHLHQGRFSGMDTIGSQLMSGRYERTTRAVLGALVSPGMSIVDVGANIGFLTLLSAVLTGPTGRVLAFEPEPRNHARLTANIEANGLHQVRVVQAACADREGTAQLSVNSAETGWHRLVEPGGSTGGQKQLQVQVTTVDAQVGESAVDVVKIDVEGFEGAVVAGMSGTLAANPGLSVILEHSPVQARLAGLDPHRPIALLRGAGLAHAYLIREEQVVLERIDVDALAGGERLKGRSANLLLRATPMPSRANLPVV